LATFWLGLWRPNGNGSGRGRHNRIRDRRLRLDDKIASIRRDSRPDEPIAATRQRLDPLLPSGLLAERAA
jgi:hypothetical protein